MTNPRLEPQNLGWATHRDMWGFPKIRGTILEVPIIRIVIFGGLYWGTPILGNYHVYTMYIAV